MSRVAVKANFAPLGAQQAGQRQQQAAFPGPIRPDNGQHLVLVNGQRLDGEHRAAAPAHRELMEGQQVSRHGARLSAG